mgnify:CR=1 FL=1
MSWLSDTARHLRLRCALTYAGIVTYFAGFFVAVELAVLRLTG